MILVSNDDGIHSEGLRALYDALTSLDEVVVVAPDRERSAASHSLTLDRPLRSEEIRPAGTRSTARRPTASCSPCRRFSPRGRAWSCPGSTADRISASTCTTRGRCPPAWH